MQLNTVTTNHEIANDPATADAHREKLRRYAADTAYKALQQRAFVKKMRRAHAEARRTRLSEPMPIGELLEIERAMPTYHGLAEAKKALRECEFEAATAARRLADWDSSIAAQLKHSEDSTRYLLRGLARGRASSDEVSTAGSSPQAEIALPDTTRVHVELIGLHRDLLDRERELIAEKRALDEREARLNDREDRLAAWEARITEAATSPAEYRPPYLDPNHWLYSQELHAAHDCVLAITENGTYDPHRSGGTAASPLIQRWLEERRLEYSLSGYGIERIRIMINWVNGGPASRSKKKTHRPLKPA